jgi:cellulose synthase/poly-beta-1,6-N-acetylglucosamine synthase-like glycosyltransferase
MSLEAVLQVLVAACAVYLGLVYASYLWLMAVGLWENRRRVREHTIDDVATVATSRFFPGVSVVVAAYNESAALPSAVRSLLALDYSEFEVIVVNDGSTDETLERLVAAFDLVPVEAAARGVVETERVRGYYRSTFDARLLVIDKDNGGKADALNAGLDHCRFRYV